SGNAAIRHHPGNRMDGLGHKGDEIPKGIVRGSSLWHTVVGLGLYSVYQIGELHGVLDEENRNVVAHEIPVALVGVKLDGKTAHVPGGVLGPTLACDGREPYKDGRLF